MSLVDSQCGPPFSKSDKTKLRKAQDLAGLKTGSA